MTVCSEVMSDDWPYENGIDVQHFRNFFFLSHHSWWWERLEMPLTYLISTPFCSVDCQRFHCIWHLFEDEGHIFTLWMVCTNCLVIWESGTYSYYTDWQMYGVPLKYIIICLT